MNVLAVILGRKGSKGCKNKNFRLLLGKPVLQYSIEHALSAKRVNKIVVTTDALEVEPLCGNLGVEFLMRPAELAGDTARVDDVVRHAAMEMDQRGILKPDIVVLLYGNIPVRVAGIIDKVVDRMIETGADSIQTFSPVGKFHPYWLYTLDGDRAEKYIQNQIHRRQDLPPLYAIDSSVAAVTYRSLVDAAGNSNPHAFWGKDRRGVVQGELDTVDIDCEYDFLMAEAVLKLQGMEQVAGYC